MISDPTHNLREVEKEIGELAQTDGATDLAATFEAVDRVLDVSSISQKEVIFSDRPASRELEAHRPRRPTTLKSVLARLEARHPRSVVIDLGKPGGENRAVTDLRLDVPVVTVGCAGPDSRHDCATLVRLAPTGVRARLTADGRLGPEEAFDLRAGRRCSGRLSPAIQHAGRPCRRASRSTAIRWRPTTAAGWSCRCVSRSMCLLVDGHFKSEPYQAETDYLAQALSPSEESPGQPQPDQGRGRFRIAAIPARAGSL